MDFTTSPLDLGVNAHQGDSFRIHFGNYNDDYVVADDKLLGRGSYGSTRKVMKLNDHKVFAMKTLYSKYLSESLSEIWISSRFRYPGIVSVYDVYLNYVNSTLQSDIMGYRDSGSWRLDIVMELCKPLPFEGVSEEQKKIWIHKLIIVLSFLQGNGVVYGDIKYDNILISEDGELKLIDMGMYYKIGYGEPPITQSYSSLGGYHKQRRPIYQSKSNRSPRTITYDVVKNAMWALGIFIITILTEKVIDYRTNLEGVPLAVYEITDNPKILDLMLKDHLHWVPLVKGLLTEPPPSFSDILWIPTFSDLTNASLSTMAHGDVLPMKSTIPCVQESSTMDKLLAYIYMIDTTSPAKAVKLRINAVSKAMAAEYLINYIVPLGLGIDPESNRSKFIEEDILEKHMIMRFVDRVRYPNLYIPGIRTTTSNGEKMLMGLPIFSLACLVFGQAVISNEYETLNIESIKTLLKVTMGSICPNIDMVFSGILYYLESIIGYTNGNYLLKNPYFEMRGYENPSQILKDASTNYLKYAKLTQNILAASSGVVSPVDVPIDSLSSDLNTLSLKHGEK